MIPPAIGATRAGAVIHPQDRRMWRGFIERRVSQFAWEITWRCPHQHSSYRSALECAVAEHGAA